MENISASGQLSALPNLEDERAIRHIVDLLFIYTDQKAWSQAHQLFVDGPIEVDMSSLNGGGPVQMTADDLLGGFQVGLHAEKLSHHMATNYQITITGDKAEVWAHGYSWNRLLNYHEGSDLWETWGNYRFSLQRTVQGWRLNAFRYFAKYNRGNDLVRTHTH
ncbi:nuclear transport factor 2 family protein [Ktedonosporobacter rubrisoli]|uniref:Nuclear transport factor 2 family protein n=1 Tax=Ktedonosporobacter rubrisoli TaxID=2509675 RepID=A0A4P6K3N2_KTERU|nr:nuclear transport factor 2 family protein [Ktedonosporobacter rubrisoli]QBD82878.1 nuclear transport factor 2 family protein [Ktedonosporobacter rubrisoli]